MAERGAMGPWSIASAHVIQRALAEDRLVMVSIFEPGPRAPCRFPGPDFQRVLPPTTSETEGADA